MNSENERFRSIYRNCMPVLRVIARRRGVPYDELDDIVQETFLSFYRHYAERLPELKDDEVHKILATIIRNRSIDYMRRRSAHPIDYLDAVQIQSRRFGTDAEKRGDALHILLENAEYQDIVDAIGNMRRDWAELFVMLAIEERPVKEVSRLLGITADNCRTRLSRIRKHLRKELECYRPDTCRDKQKTYNAPTRHSESPVLTGLPENA